MIWYSALPVRCPAFNPKHANESRNWGGGLLIDVMVFEWFETFVLNIAVAWLCENKAGDLVVTSWL